MNLKGGAEGEKVYTIWSKFDEALMYECIVWGKVTCRIPSQTDEIIKKTSNWTHIALRDSTGPDILNWIA